MLKTLSSRIVISRFVHPATLKHSRQQIQAISSSFLASHRPITTMKAIQVKEWGQQPSFNPAVPDLPKPEANSDTVQVKVLASGLHQLVRSQAAGQHYSTDPSKTPTPYIPGADGVGLTVPDNKLVYFNTVATGGGFAEYINAPKRSLIPVPLDSGNASKEETERIAQRVASLLNPGMSSYLALTTRLIPNPAKKQTTVLILGATSLSGRLAIPIARKLGFTTIIGAARRESELSAMDLDAHIVLKEPVSSTDFSILQTGNNVDVILDYVYGEALAAALAAVPANPMKAEETATQVIQIGGLSGGDMPLNSAFLRGKNITINGSGPGAWSIGQSMKELPGLIELLASKDGGLGEFDVKVRTLDEVKKAWDDKRGRTVFKIGDS